MQAGANRIVPGTAREGSQIALRILETTDLHGHIRSFDYTRDRPTRAGGLARLAGVIESARAEAGNCLLFDNGDFLQGTALTDYWGRKRGLRPGEIHPMIAAMNTVGYDAGALGNHEFNFGLDFLTRSLAGARFPLVCANAAHALGATPEGDRTLLPPWVLLGRRMRDGAGNWHALQIGVIGLVPPQIVAWDHLHLKGRLWTRCMLEAARAHVARLRAAGADLVIALAHTGIVPNLSDPENAALPLAGIEGIDILLCGHSHLCFPGQDTPASAGIDPVRGALLGKPALLPGSYGSHLGVMDVELAPTHDGWTVAAFASALRPATPGPGGSPRPQRRRVLQATAVAHRETLAYVRQRVGRTAEPLNSFFAALTPDAATALVAAAQHAHVARCLAGRPETALPLLSAAAPYKCGGRGGPAHFLDIPAGPLSTRHIEDLYPFPNTVAATEISGAELHEWLERAAGIFVRLTPGQPDQPLLNPEFPCYNFDTIFGVNYRIDLSQPPRYALDGTLLNPQARRIVGLCHAGQPVRPDQQFILATNNYRSSGAGGFCGPKMRALDLGPACAAQDALLDRVRGAPAPTPWPEPAWSFAPLPSTSAIYRTSPEALDRPSPRHAPRLEPLGHDPDGFFQIRVHF